MGAKLEGNDEAMCIHALDAGMYHEAHSLFYESVAPKAITLGSPSVYLAFICRREMAGGNCY